MTSSSALVAGDLWSAALLRGEFTLRSGVVSDRYFDKYRVLCDPDLLGATCRALAQLRAEHSPQSRRIIAPALGAVPLAAGMALVDGLPFAIVRDARKQYGTGHRIEGPIQPGELVTLVEDVVTSGGAALEAISIARDAGLVVTTALCVLDRDAGGSEALAEIGVELHSLLDAESMDAAFEQGLGTEVSS